MDKQLDKQNNYNSPVVIRLKLVSLQMDKQRTYKTTNSWEGCDSLKISIFANG